MDCNNVVLLNLKVAIEDGWMISTSEMVSTQNHNNRRPTPDLHLNRSLTDT